MQAYKLTARKQRAGGSDLVGRLTFHSDQRIEAMVRLYLKESSLDSKFRLEHLTEALGGELSRYVIVEKIPGGLY